MCSLSVTLPAMLEEPLGHRTDQRLCAPLESFGPGDLARAGGKAVNLGELIHAGFPVPAGFVISTEVYRRAMAGGATSSEVIAELGLPEGVASEIRAAYAALGGGVVAVRSSATAEDLPGAAFAGQQETYLDVTGDDQLLSAVRECWASLWSERAVSYRDRLGIDPETVAMAVVVQRMVPAEFAGVMFTAHPVSGDRGQIVIDSHPGSGEAVVSGAVTPDHAVISAGNDLDERRRGESSTRLDDVDLIRIAEMGRGVARHFGRPQDIEWAIADGQLWALQTRAMTALPPPVRELNWFQRTLGAVLVEMMPRRPLPMELTGWILPVLAPLVEGMTYEMAGLQVDFEAMLPDHDCVVTEHIPPTPRPTRHVPTHLVRSIRRALRHRPGDWSADPRHVRYLSEVRQLADLDLTTLTWQELLDLGARVRSASELVTEVRIDFLPATAVAMARLRVLLKVLGLVRHFSALVTGGETLTRQATEQLTEMADMVREDLALTERFAGLDAPALATFIENHPDAARLRERLEEFKDRFGHRETTSLLMVHDPGWGEDPVAVPELIRVLAQQPADVRSDVAEEAQRAIDAHPLVRPSGLGRIVRSLARTARDGVALREDTHSEVARLMPIIRTMIVEIGRRLADKDLILDAEDVWYLRWSEVAVEPAPGVTGRGQELRSNLARRREALEAMAGAPMVNPASLYPGRSASDALLSGVAGGGGRATGTVRVVHCAAEFGQLQTGEILVCPATNPAWTPLFTMAGAVVVDHGGLASHAAIVAREYGIPAVMATGSGTTTLRDGQTVTVDGDAGLVLDDG